MYIFDDWELRQLLDDTLHAAWVDYRSRRTLGDKPRGIDGKHTDWHGAVTMPLIIQKLSYSRSPWRIVLVRDRQPLRGLPDCGFPRKRDAQPFLARFQAVGDWDQHEAFTDAQHEAVQQILDTTPMRQQRYAPQQRVG